MTSVWRRLPRTSVVVASCLVLGACGATADPPSTRDTASPSTAARPPDTPSVVQTTAVPTVRLPTGPDRFGSLATGPVSDLLELHGRGERTVDLPGEPVPVHALLIQFACVGLTDVTFADADTGVVVTGGTCLSGVVHAASIPARAPRMTRMIVRAASGTTWAFSTAVT